MQPIRAALQIVKFVYTLILFLAVIPAGLYLVGLYTVSRYEAPVLAKVNGPAVGDICRTATGNPFGTWQRADAFDRAAEENGALNNNITPGGLVCAEGK
jgi:hypothetical protein